ncbi:MAG: DUF5714 domain-containing protein [Chloroflexota bacterium]|nr:DUF5714 domain-containing protein [Chloroflexota bacterium]
MPERSQKTAKLKSQDNCGICGTPLVYGTESNDLCCVFCGETHSAAIYCPEGHYICDSCHEQEALEILGQVLRSTTSMNPVEIVERVMSHPAVPMHGPEHHAIVPAALVAAVRNAGYPVPENAVETALLRGAQVPGGWCGFYGACGAAIGVGVAVSVLTEATPLTGEQRALANEATVFALGKTIDGHSRCCKRASRKALEASIEFLRDRMNIVLPAGDHIECGYSERNRQCPKEQCSYYVP